MEINEKFKLTSSQTFYEENWRTLMKFKGQKRRRRIFIAIWFTILIIAMFITGYPMQDPFSLLIIFYLVLILYSLFTEKQKWVKTQMKSKFAGLEAEVTFMDKYLMVTTSIADVKYHWNCFTNLFEDKESFILELDGALYLYYPKSAFSSEESYQRVLNKLYHEI